MAKKANGGSNCLNVQTLVLPSHWPQKEAFLAAVEAQLTMQKTMPCYYPGSVKRKDAMAERCHGRVRRVIGQKRFSTATEADDVVMIDCGVVGTGEGRERTLDNHCLTNEAFGPLLALVEVDSKQQDVDTYMAKACAFANSEDVCGSLSCTILAPASASASTVDRCAAALNFGTVAINAWSVFGYVCMCLGGTWGAHPADNVRSGRGRLGNIFGVENVVKTVVRSSSLEKLLVDPSVLPPPIVADLLHTLTSTSNNFGEALVKFFTFTLMRLLQSVGMMRSFGRKYGALL